LPADRTFVVQFRVAWEAHDSIPQGRVEHLVTGLAARFEGWCELRDFLEHALLRADEPPSYPTQGGSR
jgi:hypothetical protein